MIVDQTSERKLSEPELPERLLSVGETAHLLNVSTRTVDRLVTDGRLRRIKIGGATRFRRDDVNRIMGGAA